ncbi:TonB-dependent receptor [Paludibacter jiangxiensis]|uniref:CarboxypepD_reg-like domain-containing protein n=1 Tax=Paludibacter jiangxiensis TaxID=681398 RepID=A0A171AQ20_9BACT|nr:TonB-dependent receptor [Paludibacter jiangxiensis]GAT64098.1 CarboxypepD_reg-like domain-containing protein [Paludibacter jiangxiensis]
MKNLFLALFLILSATVSAQNITATGSIFDSKHQPLVGATATLVSKSNPNHKLGDVANANGNFTVKGLSIGTYTMQISFVGFTTLTKSIEIKQNNQRLGSFTLKEESIDLKEITAVGRATRAQQTEDTIKYNADAFKTIQGADASTLISKMPGIVVDGSGKIQAQGETVQKVMVDGKPFFDGDPNLALKNLPAEVVQNIEVFDKKSEQAEFTGFEDGNSVKTINVITRRGMQTGVFGKLNAGIGINEDNKTDYQGSLSMNIFKGNRRITLLGMSNNINQQNFSQDDLAGIMGGGMGMGRGGRGGGFGGGSTLVSGGGGITKTNAGGLNYTDKWGKKIDITGGYFFNITNNTLIQSKNDTYFKQDALGRFQTSDENDFSQTKNINHRFNLKLDYQIDANNSLTFMPNLSFQSNNGNSSMLYNTYLNGASSTKTNTATSRDVTANNLSGMLLYRHRFSKSGRTISLTLNGSSNQNNNDGYTEKHFLNNVITEDDYQTILNNSNGYSLGANAIYTEPLSKTSQLQATYRVNYNHRDIDKQTRDRLTMVLDTALSNLYNSDYLTQSGGLGYRLSSKGLMLMANVDVQHAALQGDQTYPLMVNTDKSYNSILPNMMLNYRFNPYNTIRVFLRASTSAPSIQQLQNVIDNSNPAAITGGNPNLNQQISNNAMFRYTFTPKSGQTLIVMFSAGNTLHYIGNSTILATKDSVLQKGIILRNGAQYSSPVNLTGSWNMNSMFTFGFPVDFLKSNLNISTNFGFNQIPSLYNGVKQMTKNYTIAPKAILGSNISDKLDFTLSYGAAYNIARNNVSSISNNTYLNQTASFKLDWIFWKGLTFQNNMSYQNYRSFANSLSSGFSQNYFMWTASVGKKIMKNDRGEIKLQAYDILRQNKSLTRNVYDNYYEDAISNVMKPFVMLSFTYDLRNFSGQKYQQQQQKQNRQRQQMWEKGGMPPAGSMPPGGGMPGGMPPGGMPMM